MKITTVDNKVESSGSIKKHTFQIKAGAKAFMVLSSTLYTNKIRAFVREICCNACDSRPGGADFTVNLPSVLEPNFVVRDYGTGISEENMFHIYTTYFESTKEDTNDDIGGFGLGSKSPFAYTTSFEVTSYFGGKMTVYSVFLDNSEPNIVKLHETESDEPTGLKVSVPIKSEHFGDVEREALFILRDFDSFNCDHHAFDDYENFPEDDMFSLDSYGIRGGVYALMGKILYPISSEFYGNTWFNFMRTGATAIRFDIGELDIAPSREQLSIDDNTRQVIHDRINNISSTSKEKYYSMFDGVTSMRKAYKIFESLDIAPTASRDIADNIVINNYSITNFKRMCDTTSFEISSLPLIGYLTEDMTTNRPKKVTNCSTWRYTTRVSGASLTSVFRESINFLIRDENKNKPLSVLLQLGLKNAVLVWQSDFDKVKETFLKYYNEDEIIVNYTSEYVAPPKGERKPVNRTEREYFYYEVKDGDVVRKVGTVSLFRKLEGNMLFLVGDYTLKTRSRQNVFYKSVSCMEDWLIENGEDVYVLPIDVEKTILRNKKLVDVPNNMVVKFNQLKEQVVELPVITGDLSAFIKNYGNPVQQKAMLVDVENKESVEAYKELQYMMRMNNYLYTPNEIEELIADTKQRQIEICDNILENDLFLKCILENFSDYELADHSQKLLEMIKF